MREGSGAMMMVGGGPRMLCWKKASDISDSHVHSKLPSIREHGILDREHGLSLCLRMAEASMSINRLAGQAKVRQKRMSF